MLMFFELSLKLLLTRLSMIFSYEFYIIGCYNIMHSNIHNKNTQPNRTILSRAVRPEASAIK